MIMTGVVAVVVVVVVVVENGCIIIQGGHVSWRVDNSGINIIRSSDSTICDEERLPDPGSACLLFSLESRNGNFLTISYSHVKIF